MADFSDEVTDVDLHGDELYRLANRGHPRGRILKVKALDYYDFKGTDIALMSAGGSTAKEWAPKIAAQGCMVIDNSSHWRMDRPA